VGTSRLGHSFFDQTGSGRGASLPPKPRIPRKDIQNVLQKPARLICLRVCAGSSLTACGVTTMAMESAGVYWPARPDPGDPRLSSAAGQCAAGQERAGPQARCARSPVAAEAAHLYVVRGSFRAEDGICVYWMSFNRGTRGMEGEAADGTRMRGGSGPGPSSFSSSWSSSCPRRKGNGERR
jgi:hypothetical protein